MNVKEGTGRLVQDLLTGAHDTSCRVYPGANDGYPIIGPIPCQRMLAGWLSRKVLLRFRNRGKRDDERDCNTGSKPLKAGPANRCHIPFPRQDLNQDLCPAGDKLVLTTTPPAPRGYGREKGRIINEYPRGVCCV